MSARPTVSVCMATYNGARFLHAQMTSIVDALRPDDEIIVIDDGSTDDTLSILRSFDDPRMRIERNPSNIGPQQTFHRAMRLATREIIILADQDDVWLPGRVDALVEQLRDGKAQLVSSNSEYISADDQPVEFPMPPLKARDAGRRWTNIARIFAGRAPYYACTMAFRSEFRRLVLPIPRYAQSHDLWLAMAANLVRAVVHLERRTLRRRIHGNNVSIGPRPLHRKLWARVAFARGLVHLSWRIAASR